HWVHAPSEEIQHRVSSKKRNPMRLPAPDQLRDSLQDDRYTEGGDEEVVRILDRSDRDLLLHCSNTSYDDGRCDSCYPPREVEGHHHQIDDEGSQHHQCGLGEVERLL